jgi:hypothetical protein
LKLFAPGQALLRIKLNLKNTKKFIWQCVFVILLLVCKFLVMKTEHTFAPAKAGILQVKCNGEE